MGKLTEEVQWENVLTSITAQANKWSHMIVDEGCGILRECGRVIEEVGTCRTLDKRRDILCRPKVSKPNSGLIAYRFKDVIFISDFGDNKKVFRQQWRANSVNLVMDDLTQECHTLRVVVR